MRSIAKLRLRLISIFLRSRVEDELDDELRFYVEREISEHLAHGMDARTARNAALRRFGDLQKIKEECRDMRRVNYIENLLQDIHYGVRILARTPGFTAVAVLTLALGIGANTAIFSLVNGILLNSLPYSDPDQLVSLTEYYPKGGFALIRDQSKTMDAAYYWEGEEFNLAQQGLPPVRLNGTEVSAELFSVLGVNADIGRTFRAGDDSPGNDRSVILSHALWDKQFAKDPSAIGRSILIEGTTRQIVGVMPAGFGFPSTKTNIWIPMRMDPGKVGDYWGPQDSVIARLKPGVTMQQASLELKALVPKILGACPFPLGSNWNNDSTVIPLRKNIVGEVRSKLFILLGAVGLILLMACANVANLLLARSASRRKEVAIRSALGAGRARVIRQLLTESTLLAITGGLTGLIFAAGGLALLKALLPANTPRLGETKLDGHVLLFTAALAVTTGLIFGLAPAIESSKINLTDALNATWRRSAGTGTGRIYNALVIIEMGLAVLLVIGAGLLIKSLWLLSRANTGFQPEHILTLQITPDASFGKDRNRSASFYDELLRRTHALPGVKDVAAINSLPLSGDIPILPVQVEGYPDETQAPAPLLWAGAITPGYTKIMGIPVLEGREFSIGDRTDTASVMLVSASTARHFWPGQSAVGKHIRAVWEKDWKTVVGVVADVKQYGLTAKRPGFVDGEVYMPYSQAVVGHRQLPSSMTLVMQADTTPSQIGPALREIVANLNADIPVTDARTMNDVVSSSISSPRSTTKLFGIFAGLALLLGAVGIYSLMSYSVSQRTHEVGVRMALGAKRRDVLSLIAKQGMLLTALGIGLGIGAAFGLTRLLEDLLYEVKPIDLATFAAVPLLLLAVALLASYIPARRATKVDPMVALRFE